ncbi:Alcohol dehydrogenase YqhD [Shewanella baltica]|uniref:Iron-containing alcohol dehydrogenase n=1 Tax=Shewanella baltica (strain OS195) TaxID=399599 RepID=A9KX57_SHEB9|nr:iron-containing alcohol dehydrogenase [Shewanella baltica]ABX47453.1 iron-containing alcohol dehydrogenase [Shewanella baltica OS195]ADT92479.1 iron-containing alcohol dehydrogenase [Shewanella baltica OS678]EHC05047.1 Alcohol dehydrogenase (NADP(+)) [Shewanella baltica OS625]MCS6154989.1 iron-containing alcohol dehydrogenase [Shewanella baltica]MCS6233138.1 iron-containing alcohol dehydrogenase [Shewanella baltica]
MLNFNYYNPTRIRFGKDTIAEIDALVPSDAKVMILFGGSSARKTGTLDEVKQSLGNRFVVEFDGIEPNPTYETLMKAVAQVREQKIDFLLAVGGGSVIDGTKFVAAAAVFEGEPWDILTSWGAKVTQAMSFGSVLTLPATGSEMNNASVVTRKSLQAKLPFRNDLVYPQFSILDPTKTFTLPERQVANGVVDAFVHITEQYLTYPVNAAVQDRFAEGLLQTLIELGPQVLVQPEDYDIRANLMWVATMALNGTIGVGVPHDWATHMIGHELTALYDIDHARTLAIVLPALLQCTKEAKREKLLQYADRVWHINTGTDDERIDAAIAKTKAFFEAMGIPTHLSAYDLDASHVDTVVKQLELHGMVALGEHGNINPAMSRDILTLAL